MYIQQPWNVLPAGGLTSHDNEDGPQELEHARPEDVATIGLDQHLRMCSKDQLAKHVS
jgi:hypothetical protein